MNSVIPDDLDALVDRLERAAEQLRSGELSADDPAQATSQQDALFGEPSTLPAFGTVVARGIPVGRMGQPSEFGATAAFLASPLAGYITGSTIRLEGGAIPSI